jgi:hypothetical protein
MEKYLAGILLVLCSSVLSAKVVEVDRKVVCDDTEKMFKSMKDNYGEDVAIYAEQGEDESGSPIVRYLSIWTSKNGETISVIETFKEYNMSCLVAAGKNLRFRAKELL